MLKWLLICTVASRAAERACRTYDVSSRNDTAQKAVWEAVPRTDCEACLLFTLSNCTKKACVLLA